jgi:hypothetical protein
MADVTISQLSQGTPNNDALIPYSQGGITLAVAPSALLVNACTQNPGFPNFGNGVGINSSSARVPLEVANKNGWPYNIYVSGTAPNIYFGQNVGKFPNPGSGNSFIPNPLVDSSGPAAAFIGFSTATGNYGVGLGDLNICTQSSSANNSNAINFMTPLDDASGLKVSMKISKQGYVTTLYQAGFKATITAGTISTGQTVLWNSVEYQTPDNSFNTSTGEWTAPQTGRYLICVGLISLRNTANGDWYVDILVNGATATGGRFYTSKSGNQNVHAQLNGSGIFKLNTGDKIKIILISSVGDVAVSSLHNLFCAELLG